MYARAFFLILFFLMMTLGRAAVVPGRWEKIDSLLPGTDLLVLLHSDDQLEGRYKESDSEFLVIETDTISELWLLKEDVARILSAEMDDRLLDGTLIGAGIGFGVGFFGLAAFNAKATASGPIWDGEAVAIYSSAGILGAGVGAMTGAFLDKASKQREELYRSK